MRSIERCRFQWPSVTHNLDFKVTVSGLHVDALDVLCAQLMRDLFAIAKFSFLLSCNIRCHSMLVGESILRNFMHDSSMWTPRIVVGGFTHSSLDFWVTRHHIRRLQHACTKVFSWLKFVHHRQEDYIVTFLIIAPYKYSYLLTLLTYLHGT